MINTEENYKVYADEVFEVFRNGNCEQGQGYTLWKVRADLAKEVDESRLHKLYLTLKNLMDSGYFGSSSFDPTLVVLTSKGVDYISGKSPLVLEMSLNKYIDIENVSVDEAFVRLWDVIGNDQSALFPLDETSFYSVMRNLNTNLPATYADYIAQEGLNTTSIADVYKALLMTIDSSLKEEVLDKMSAVICQKYSISQLDNQYIPLAEDCACTRG
ncbi:hypothetical protein [Bacteroides propionicifaciens]|uniref:hypothetical protein n=1 Tax=Bacteroides propionicifaciens TaxID=392838 RepID=UPI0003814E77|nr:hypothetical protein [Bacteroides propionicifaciens]